MGNLQSKHSILLGLLLQEPCGLPEEGIAKTISSLTLRFVKKMCTT